MKVFLGHRPLLKVIFFCLLAVTAKGETQEEYDQILEASLRAHSEAQDFHQWMESKNNPDNYFGDLLKSSQLQPEDLCLSLKKLKLSQLTLFFNVLGRPESLEMLGCTGRLRRNLNDYYELKQKTIQQKVQFMVNNMEGLRSEESLATEVVELDPNGGPRMVYGNLPEKVLNFTFDDGPREETTLDVLETLDKYKVKANFFQVGKNIARLPEITREVALRGHFVGNHSWTHPQMNRIPYNRSVNEIEETFGVLEETIENWVPFFRFPYGAATRDLKGYLRQHNTPEFFWSIDTQDWKHRDPEVLLEYALGQIVNVGRGIVLFHDVQPQTAVVLPEIFAVLNRQGYKTVAFDVAR